MHSSLVTDAMSGIKVNKMKTVKDAFDRFDHLLIEFEPPLHQEEPVAVKIDVESKPPQGVVLDTTIEPVL